MDKLAELENRLEALEQIMAAEIMTMPVDRFTAIAADIDATADQIEKIQAQYIPAPWEI